MNISQAQVRLMKVVEDRMTVALVVDRPVTERTAERLREILKEEFPDKKCCVLDGLVLGSRVRRVICRLGANS